MGEVYLGVQPEIGARVAIKLLSADAATSPGLVERFFAENGSMWVASFVGTNVSQVIRDDC